MLSNVFDVLAKEKTYGTADTTNAEGFVAWTMPDKSRIKQLCMVGVTGNTYYTDEKKLISEGIVVLERMAQEDPAYLAECLIEGRARGFIRTMNIIGLVYLSKYDTVRFKQIFDDVILTGGDLGDFIDICHKIRGFGRAVKTAIAKWVRRNTSEYYAIKYRNQIRDAIRITREMYCEPVFDWIMENDEMMKDKSWGNFEQINRYEMAKWCIANNEWDAAIVHIDLGKLDFATLTSYGDPTPKAWGTLARNMGVMALLKHLNKLDSVGVWNDEEAISWLRKKFSVSAFQKAKVFPFRLYIAYRNVTNEAVKDILAGVLDTYVTTYDWSEWKGQYVIAPDVSSSMNTSVMDSALTPAVVAGMFSGILYKGIPGSQIMAWDTKAYKYPNPRQDSVITHINNVANARGGGTYMEVPVLAMIANRIKADYLIQITDSEEWGSGWLAEWVKYRRQNPKAKAILLRVDLYNTNPFPEDKARELGIYQIFGWSDNVIGYVEKCVMN